MYSSANLISAFYLIYTLFINSSFSVYCCRLLIPRFIRIPLKYAGIFCYCFCFRKQEKIEINGKSLPRWRASVLEDSPCIPTGSLSLSVSVTGDDTSINCANQRESMGQLHSKWMERIPALEAFKSAFVQHWRERTHSYQQHLGFFLISQKTKSHNCSQPQFQNSYVIYTLQMKAHLCLTQNSVVS